jgi:S1-C subfamily serine protease
VVTFDQQHQRVRLRTDGSGTVSFPPVRSSGLSIEARDGTWIVVSVSPGGPADSAGVRAGDEVVACEGRPMSVSRCDAPWAGLPDDSRVTLGLRIDGAERRVTIDRPIVVP